MDAKLEARLSDIEKRLATIEERLDDTVAAASALIPIMLKAMPLVKDRIAQELAEQIESADGHPTVQTILEGARRQIT